MKKAQHIWVVVSDGANARFLAVSEAARRFVPAGPAEMSSDRAKARSSDLKSDRPGRSFSSSRGGHRHALEPKHDYHKMEKHRLSAAVAAVLDRARAKRAFDDLIIVAPRRSLGEIRSLLSDRVQDCVREEIAKDLTKLPPDALLRTLRPVIDRVFHQTI